MDFQSLKLAYSGRGKPFEGNALVLEQKEWSPYDGAITNTSMVNALANFIYGQVASSTSQVDSSVLGGSFGGNNSTNVECSLDADGCMTATIYAYPVPFDLNYTLRVTHGSVSSRHESVEEFRELVQVRLQDPNVPISPDYPIRRLIDYEWFGNVYDNLGNVMPPPRISVEDTDIYVAARVYGTIDVTYTVEKHVYTVEITPDTSRPEEDWWKSVAYAPFEGGVEWEEIDPAPSVDLNFSSCGSFVQYHFGDDDLPFVDGNDKRDIYDYCGGELLETKY